MEVLPQIADRLERALGALLGESGKELGGMAADHIRFLRWKSAVSIIERAKRFCARKKINPSRVPIKFIIPFLDAASMEDIGGSEQEILADRWAALLASAVTDFQSRHISYMETLKRLSTEDARFLQKLFTTMKSGSSLMEGFDPAVANVSDVPDVQLFFSEAFAKASAKKFKKLGTGTHQSALGDQFYGIAKRCGKGLVWRKDIAPYLCDISGFEGTEMVWGVAGPVDLRTAEIIPNLLALSIIETFSHSVFFPDAPTSVSEFRIRCIMSWVALNSYGYGFLQACQFDKESAHSGRERRPARRTN